MSDDGWGDMFAMAAGAPNVSTNQSIPNDHKTKTPEITKKKKKAKKRKRGRSNDDSQHDDEFQQMLELRMSCKGEAVSSNACEWHLEAYKALRTLRAAGFSQATGYSKNGLDQRVVGQLSALNFPSYLDPGEVEILREKQQSVKTSASVKDMTFKSNVRVIIACDDFYLRLYYLQVSGAFPLKIYLPHPVSYFDNPESGEALATIHKKHLKGASYFDLGEDGKQHPLSKIYRQRQLETYTLFASHDPTGRATLKVLNRPIVHAPTSLEYHNTPASEILEEWRDSCRDVLCHLYCYATLSPTNITALVKKMKLLGANNAIELGAGTGYIAKLLHDADFQVQAYDIDPPSDNMNEYHGRTHAYVNVKKGTHESVLTHHSLTESTALLMCYPPPQCSMAYDALNAFQSAGGKYLVHIGEWKGLTGSKQFEELLLRDFQCVHRTPCSSWGTDAADVTIWEKGSDSTLLLPCIACGKSEATKRCRLLRHAVYCSRDCFEGHSEQFRAMCRLSATPLLDLDFDNELHFQSLPANAEASKERKVAS